MEKLISHESPLSLLEDSRYYNDYDYALVHLFESEPNYLNFFKASLDLGRKVILDNSIFELGEAFNMDNFAYWVEKLKPTEFIIPDTLEDCKSTKDKIDEWLSKYSHLKGVKIGVVQGKTYEEIVDCYKHIDNNCDKIAISFDYSYYLIEHPHSNKYSSWMSGRINLINRLVRDRVINRDKPHHLLGCSLPQEFHYYSNKVYNFIESIDTSNPIVHGIKGKTYNSTLGLFDKESIKLVDLLHTKLNTEQLQDIYYNIKTFKTIVNNE